MGQESENISEQLLSREWSLIYEVHSIKGDTCEETSQKMTPIPGSHGKILLYLIDLEIKCSKIFSSSISFDHFFAGCCSQQVANPLLCILVPRLFAPPTGQANIFEQLE